MPYPKRLIEVDLPIKRISAHSRREKSIRHGHISTLHIWWARRPLAACRAVLCASLWPDPADELCPEEFIEFAKKEMIKWADNEHLILLSKESIQHFIKLNHDKTLVNKKIFLRQLLLDFIADFANWDNSNKTEYLNSSRALTQAAHIALGGEPGTNPLVVDPFAGGGSIPLEALRVGADAFASDLNPIPVLLNKIQLEYIPQNGLQLAEEIRKYGEQLKVQAEHELGKYFTGSKELISENYKPQIKSTIKKDNKIWQFQRIVKETPIAYLWARTIKCEGPNCGCQIPLLKGTYLAKKGTRSVGFKLNPNPKLKKVTFELIDGIKESETKGTILRGNVTCPFCGFVTRVGNVRTQLKSQNGGANSSILFSVVSILKTERFNQKTIEEFEETGRFYRVANEQDILQFDSAKKLLESKLDNGNFDPKMIPMESLPINVNGKDTTLGFRVQGYGINEWGKIFNYRQTLVLLSLINAINSLKVSIELRSLLGLVIGRLADGNSTLARWQPTGEKISNTFGRQVLPIVWDYCEANPFCESTRNLTSMFEWIAKVAELSISTKKKNNGSSYLASADNIPLGDDSSEIFFSDPPYYDAVPYSDLSDFFYVWLKRVLGKHHKDLFKDELSNKIDECIVDEARRKDKSFFISKMAGCMLDARRITKPNGLGVIVFAHKSTDGWEAQLDSMLNAGWIFTASWPIDTEMATRLRAQDSAALASSVHLVCRPRENKDGSLIQNQIGDWRDVQQELPKRIHEWMPRLAAEGVAGADAIFACLGPALEIFSRYSKVVEAGKEREIPLKEYLEKVWAAVSQEALRMVLNDGDAKSLEPDARLTAMWLWTLTAGASDTTASDDEEESDDEEISSSGKLTGGFTLEYDTARKIAQGLGANLEDLKTLVEVKGDKARLLPVMERTSKLFGSSGIQQQPIKKKKKVQLSLSFENVEHEAETKFEIPELKVEQTGKTVLDRLHQAMLLFSTGRTEALKRFLVEDGAGKDDRFWKLAQSLTSLYPKDTDERRWVEAVQTYKKSLGF